MAYFEDLSPNSHHDVAVIREVVMLYGRATVLQTVNVGWLEPLRRYPKGRTPKQFREKLRALCASPSLRHRGFFSCKMGLCKLVPGWPLGEGENVGWHRYRPPQEFVDAVVDL